MVDGFFVAESDQPDQFGPQTPAITQWRGGRTLRGMAISAIMARAVEQAAATAGVAQELRPARWTLDLSRPVANAPVATRVHVHALSRRLAVFDVDLLQEDAAVVSGRALYVRPGGVSGGDNWLPERGYDLTPPPLVPKNSDRRLYWSDGVGWTQTATEHMNASRKRMWVEGRPTVAGETLTPFQLVAAIADVTSLVCNWSTIGLGHINLDLSVSMARLPEGRGLGLVALERSEDEGVATGTAALHDLGGVIGVCTVIALANDHRTVDPRARDSEAS